MSFHVGQKVVCVVELSDWALEPLNYLGQIPTWCEVYTVSFVGHCVERDAAYLELAEIPKSGWDADAFRPAVERKTDITIFEQMLTPSTRNLEPTMTDDRSNLRSPIADPMRSIYPHGGLDALRQPAQAHDAHRTSSACRLGRSCGFNMRGAA